jgi:hypothetical protein
MITRLTGGLLATVAGIAVVVIVILLVQRALS